MRGLDHRSWSRRWRRGRPRGLRWAARADCPGALELYRPLSFPSSATMRALILCVVLAVSASGNDSRLDEARQALDDGLPQVAIYKLRQVPGRKFAKEDQAAAELLLARALFAA